MVRASSKSGCQIPLLSFINNDAVNRAGGLTLYSMYATIHIILYTIDTFKGDYYASCNM